MTIRVKVTATINPTEDEEKVLKAIKNLVNQDKIGKMNIIKNREKQEILIEGNLDLLFPLKNKIALRRIQPQARLLLIKNKRDNSSYLLLNKQVAYVNNVSLCESRYESPLGPITIEIICDDSEELDLAIMWLTEELNMLSLSG